MLDLLYTFSLGATEALSIQEFIFQEVSQFVDLEICGVEQHPITVRDTGDYVDIEYNQYRFVTVLFQACSNLQLHAQACCGKFEHA